MHHACLALLLACVVLAPATAGAPASAGCLDAAADAEQRWNLPRGVLAAIGQVESGQLDAAAGGTQPWPWTANVAGLDYVFASALEAANVVTFLRERGIASIDVGCFQVNLRYHPGAFGSVREAFDPRVNANYAARFLRGLYQRSGSWVWAIGAYHSTDPAEASPYRAKVLRAWFERGGGGAADVRPIPVYTSSTLPGPLRAIMAGAQGRAAARIVAE